MDLHLDAVTTVPDIIIDYIQVRLESGEEVALNWEYSGVTRTPNGFHAVYTGVYFGEDDAAGKLEALRNMVIVDIGLCTETEEFPYVLIQSMRFLDGGSCLEFTPPAVEEVKL